MTDTQTPRLRLALFDLDHTLLPLDSDYEWGEFTIRLGWNDPVEFARRNDEFYAHYQAGTLDVHDYVRFATEAVRLRGPEAAAAAHAQFGLVDPGVAAGVLAVVSLTMGTLPFVSLVARRAAQRVAKQVTDDAPAIQLPPSDHAKRVIVVGHGRVGQLVCDLLDKHEIAYIAADRDAARVERWRKLGRPVYFGDAANSLFLQRCGSLSGPAMAPASSTKSVMPTASVSQGPVVLKIVVLAP